jgi:hypothetical protein
VKKRGVNVTIRENSHTVIESSDSFSFPKLSLKKNTEQTKTINIIKRNYYNIQYQYHDDENQSTTSCYFQERKHHKKENSRLGERSRRHGNANKQ